MEDFKSIDISKQDKEKFFELMPFFLNFYQNRILDKNESYKVDDDKYKEMVDFLQGKEDYEVEELIGEYLFINSNNPIGQSMSLAQLFEAISRFARTPEKEVDDRDPDLGEYGYNPINDKIEGVQTPTRHQMLKAKNEIKEDRLRRLGLGAIHRIEQDQKDRGIIDSGSVDDIFRRFDDNPPRENK
jgi:hypothetical protein